MKYVAIILLCFGITVLQAQEVHVSGHVEARPAGTLVRIQAYADPFSHWVKTLSSTQTDEDGNFKMDFSVPNISYAFLTVALKRGEFVVRPGASYHFQVFPDTSNQKGSVFDQLPLSMNLQAQDGQLNQHIGQFNQDYNNFILQHFNDIYQFHRKEVLEQFKQQISQEFTPDTSGFLKQYIKYSIASLVWGGRFKSAEEIANTYFIGQKVYYHNIQYADFFRNFFQSYLESKLKNPMNRDRLLDVIPYHNLKLLDSLFSKDLLLANDLRVRQLIEMVIMEKFYHDPAFRKADFDVLFKQISGSSPYKKNRDVATACYSKLRQLSPGTKAPEIHLPDFMGNEFTWINFKNKFVLLGFFKAGCPVCKQQLALLKNMQDQLGPDFTNVTIMGGGLSENLIKDFSSGKYNWPLLLLGKRILLLEKYQVRTYPAYVLIAPDGTVAMAPAPMPEGNALQKIRLFQQAYKKSHKSKTVSNGSFSPNRSM